MQPLTNEPVRCVVGVAVRDAAQAARRVRQAAATSCARRPATRRPTASTSCASGSPEARQLQAAGNNDGCQQAALEAIAVARGMPRWRQYAKLNVGEWPKNARYRTRFDGILDEDTLFADAQSLGAEAEAVFATCGGAAGAPTTAEQEQSFHTCW